MWYFPSVPGNGKVGELSAVSVRAVKLPGTVTSGAVVPFGVREGEAPRLAEQAPSRSASTATSGTARRAPSGRRGRYPTAGANVVRSGPLLMGSPSLGGIWCGAGAPGDKLLAHMFVARAEPILRGAPPSGRRIGAAGTAVVG